MSKEIGPREKALRAQREADFEDNQRLMREQSKADRLAGLQSAVAKIPAKKPKKAKKAKKGKRRG